MGNVSEGWRADKRTLACVCRMPSNNRLRRACTSMHAHITQIAIWRDGRTGGEGRLQSALQAAGCPLLAVGQVAFNHYARARRVCVCVCVGKPPQPPRMPLATSTGPRKRKISLRAPVIWSTWTWAITPTHRYARLSSWTPVAVAASAASVVVVVVSESFLAWECPAETPASTGVSVTFCVRLCLTRNILW